MIYANELNITEGAAPTTKQQLQHPVARYLCYTVRHNGAAPVAGRAPKTWRASYTIQMGCRGIRQRPVFAAMAAFEAAASVTL